MSVRLVSSAKNLRESFKTQAGTSTNLPSSSGISIFTATSDMSQTRPLDPTSPYSGSNPSLSRQGSLLRSSSNGNLRRAKSIQKKGLMSKVFAEAEAGQNMAMPDLSMEMTLLVVKRCVKEIRERGKFNYPLSPVKGILRQVQMGQSQKLILNTIRMILDDDATTELSPLHRIDIHLVAHAMKWAIRYSEDTLVTLDDYRSLYLDQDRNFTKFIKDLPATNRSILLDLFSLCADVTLLAHLNGMTLVVVAKAISLSIMAEPEREFTTFDASLQQRNLWGAACEDLLRAFLRIKTQYDLAKIDQPDDWDENTYFCSETRVLKSARQQNEGKTNMRMQMPHHNLPSRLDISLPSSAGSSMPMSATTPRSFANANGYFDTVLTPQSASPLSHAGGVFGASLSRTQSLAKSNVSISRPTSPLPASPRPTSPYYEEERTEYEEIMQDMSHLNRLRQQENNMSAHQLLRPAPMLSRRRSSVADMESLYDKSNDPEAPDAEEGYDSDPEVTYANEPEEPHDSLIPDFADGLGWDFNQNIDMRSDGMPSLASFQREPLRTAAYLDKHGVSRSNSASSNSSGFGLAAPPGGSLRGIRELPQDKLASMRMRHMQDNQPNLYQALNRAQSQQEIGYNGRASGSSSPQNSLHRMAASNNARIGQVLQNHPARASPPMRPQRARRNSSLRRSMSMDPFSSMTMGLRSNRRPSELYSEPIILHPQQLQTDGQSVIDFVVNDPYLQLHDICDEEPARASSEFSLQSSPMDLEGLPVQPRRRSQMTLNDRPKSMMDLNNVRDMPSFTTSMGLRSQTSQPFGNTLSLPIDTSHLVSSPVRELPAEKAFEVVSRPPKVAGEVSVIFTSLATGPLSPRGEVKSKFQESFPERPISPPPGYIQGQGASSSSTTGSNSTRSNSSTASSPPNRSRSTGDKNRPALQQGVTFSSSSTSSSQQLSVDTGNKHKTPGFIRALSFKLRNKQSDDQLKPVRINNQAVGTAATIVSSAPSSATSTTTATSATAPVVSIEPPRLELNFIDDMLGAVTGAGGKKQEDSILSPAPATAPAFMHHGSEGRSSHSWRRLAQDSFPISVGSSASIASTITTTTATTESTSGFNGNSANGLMRARNTFNGARRASAASIMVGPSSSGSLSPTREQHRRKTISKSPLMTAAAVSAFTAAAAKKKNGMDLSPPSSPLGGRSKKSNIASSVMRDLSGEVLVSDSSYTTDDSGAASNEEESTSSSTDPSSMSVSLKSSSSDGAMSPKRQEINTPTSPIRARTPKKAAFEVEKKEYRFSTATLLKDGKLYYQVQWDQFSELGFKSEFLTEPEQYLSGIQKSQRMVSSSQEDPWKQQSSTVTAAEEKEKEANSVYQQSQSQQQQRAMTATYSDLPGQHPSRLGQAPATNKNSNGQYQNQQDQGPSPAQRAAALKAAQESFIALAKDPKKMAALKAGAASASGAGGVGQATIISSGSFARGSTMPQLDSVPRAVNSPESKSMGPSRAKSMPLSPSGGSGHGSLSSSSSSDKRSATTELSAAKSSSTTGSGKSKGGLFGKKFKASKKSATTAAVASPSSGLPSSANGGRKRRLLPLGVRRQDVMTRTVEKMDEVFPWMCIEHMAGQESGWVMLEPVEDGAVGWVIVDKLEEEVARYTGEAQQQQQMQQQELQQHKQEQAPVHPFESQAVLQVEVA
ncbi:hypothetical protein BGZ96_001821 [Linnemannia gamsii]|uniref:Rho-GAP domain-containing protein n=1 Tax=Linnemannia gamsii TaxID=64522 RepID=A0ABQ7JLV2_9FUNG|nr:hypothetical protein BGZ96_001821 [Linnemannia gamsii]